MEPDGNQRDTAGEADRTEAVASSSDTTSSDGSRADGTPDQQAADVTSTKLSSGGILPTKAAEDDPRRWGDE
ncbi:hypothetical protein SB912_30705, partial [Pantoea sp. SIMBA_072]